MKWEELLKKVARERCFGRGFWWQAAEDVRFFLERAEAIVLLTKENLHALL